MKQRFLDYSLIFALGLDENKNKIYFEKVWITNVIPFIKRDTNGTKTTQIRRIWIDIKVNKWVEKNEISIYTNVVSMFKTFCTLYCVVTLGIVLISAKYILLLEVCKYNVCDSKWIVIKSKRLTSRIQIGTVQNWPFGECVQWISNAKSFYYLS